ncbi:hypothetical protein C5C71_02295 [Rathayibacter sp. AY1C1]|nr:hypothetical protein C5C71_02295 [Rathayibacter sp. AY1C1]
MWRRSGPLRGATWALGRVRPVDRWDDGGPVARRMRSRRVGCQARGMDDSTRNSTEQPSPTTPPAVAPPGAGQPPLPVALLLLLRRSDGRPAASSGALDTVLAASVLAELSLQRRVEVDAGAVALGLERSALGDAVLDGALGWIAAERAPRSVSWWIARLTRRELHAALLERVAAVEPAEDERLRIRVAEVLAARRAPLPSDAALIGLLDAAGALSPRPGIPDRQAIRSLAAQHWAGPAAAAVLAGTAASVTGAAVIAATTTVTITGM